MAFLLSIFKPIAYFSLPVILIRTVAASSPIGLYYVRRGLYLGCMTAIATMGIVVAATMSLVGRRYDVNWVIARSFYTLAGNVLDIQVEVEGEEHLGTKPAILLSNHQSMLDILFVGRMMPQRTSIMAKKSLQFTPLGPFMIMSGAVFIDRGNSARAVRSLEAAGELMKNRKVSLWIYPEGTRHLSEEPDLLPFKKGAFHLAVQSGIPVIPIVTENYWKIYRQGFFGTGVVKIRVLPPIPTEGLSVNDVPELTTRVRDQMLDALRDISPKVDSKTQASEQPRDSQTSTIPKESEARPSLILVSFPE
ncbi:1-acyl-sn-glycerol-3-phosphate-acyltransferase [Gymnopus androsaceus JB14]|uniref:1-acyl-sn-glycerol-3-phosphate acyltransferase n=1 Tax=Gymnopus androsaceus JB14 TaxID=1447944 RepID=A0A6A4IBS1_9AGAR|nr:1-acyl-sn-glycerol-3-phosphate-acyltransferase [Gymnopus androsaceus JB14]